MALILLALVFAGFRTTTSRNAVCQIIAQAFIDPLGEEERPQCSDDLRG